MQPCTNRFVSSKCRQQNLVGSTPYLLRTYFLTHGCIPPMKLCFLFSVQDADPEDIRSSAICSNVVSCNQHSRAGRSALGDFEKTIVLRSQRVCHDLLAIHINELDPQCIDLDSSHRYSLKLIHSLTHICHPQSKSPWLGTSKRRPKTTHP